MNSAPVTALWAFAALWLFLALACFLIRGRPCALHLRRIARVALALALARGVLLLAGCPFQGALDAPLWGVVPLAVLNLVSREVWLIRAEIAQVRETVTRGCEGLFIQIGTEINGKLELTARGNRHHLQLMRIGARLTLMLMPSTVGSGKVTLLLNWLLLQYPGPFPRPRISFKRRQR